MKLVNILDYKSAEEIRVLDKLTLLLNGNGNFVE